MVFNKIFGIPNNDKISLKKYRIKVFEYILLSLCFIAYCYLIIDKDSSNRIVSVTADYKEKINLPSFYLGINSLLGLNFIGAINFLKYRGASMELMLNCSNSMPKINCDYHTVNETFVYISEDMIGFYSNDDFALGEKEVMSITIITTSFLKNITYSVFFMYGDDIFYSDSTQQFTIGTSKKILQTNGEKNELFINSFATSNSKEVDISSGQLVVLTYTFYFNENAVITEKIESNFELSIRILSDIGSYITILLGVVGFICSRIITRLFIKDKSGWFDTETHECITYHFDQIKLKNYEMYKIGVEKLYPQNVNGINNSDINIESNKL
ncbi:hypothetical protein RB653_009327 [Dictyostelium firmibasis]|uniref:Transmembrane protein n=1 Tax=Dictyostelium firmibasis TaxID=79012 RepID=A0AAN7U0V5_9MYCE